MAAVVKALQRVAKNGNQRYPLHVACQLGNLEEVKKLAKKYDLTAPNDNDFTPLACAVMGPSVEVVKWLLKEPSVSPDAPSLRLSVEARNEEITLLLLRHSVKTEGQVQACFEWGSQPVLEHLVKKNLGLDELTEAKYLQTALSIACEEGAEETATYLLWRNLSYNKITKTRQRAFLFHHSCKIRNYASACELFSEKNKTAFLKRVPEDLKWNWENEELTLLLIEADYPVEKLFGSSLDEAFQKALSAGHYKLAKSLKTQGAEVMPSDFPLLDAIKEDNRDLAKFLIESCGAKVDDYGPSGKPLLFLAPSFEMVQILIKGGADVNATDSEGNTFLLRATEDKRVDVVALLLDRPGCDPNLGSQKPLVKACEAEDLTLIRQLLERGARPKILMYLPLRICMGKGGKQLFDECFDALSVEHQREFQDRYGLSEAYRLGAWGFIRAWGFLNDLQQAVFDGDYERGLELARGWNAPWKEKFPHIENTLLHQVCTPPRDRELDEEQTLSRLELAAYLVSSGWFQSGTPINERNSEGNTPLDLACKHRLDDLATFLMRRGGTAKREYNSYLTELGRREIAATGVVGGD